jgi:hypothetical protein
MFTDTAAGSPQAIKLAVRVNDDRERRALGAQTASPK